MHTRGRSVSGSACIHLIYKVWEMSLYIDHAIRAHNRTMHTHRPESGVRARLGRRLFLGALGSRSGCRFFAGGVPWCDTYGLPIGVCTYPDAMTHHIAHM